MRRGMWLLITLRSRTWQAASVQQLAIRSAATHTALRAPDGSTRHTQRGRAKTALYSIWPPLPARPQAIAHGSARVSIPRRNVAATARRKADADAEAATAPPGNTAGDAELSTTQTSEPASDAPVKRRRKRIAKTAPLLASGDTLPSSSNTTHAPAADGATATTQVRRHADHDHYPGKVLL